MRAGKTSKGGKLLKIDDKMIEQAYLTAKAVYNEDIKLIEGADSLKKECNMNDASAKDYIYAFRQMRNGEAYKRTINTAATTYYLQHILNDYGYDGLQTALQSVNLHIEYYESSRHGRLDSISIEELINIIKSNKEK
jgi:5-methylcytosine-specific restriction protein A